MQGERRAAERSKRTSPRAKLMKFYPGNYVLHSRRGQASGGREKLQHVWTGPHRVVEEIHPCLYVLEKVLDGTRFQSHVSYLRLYDDGELQLTHDLRNVIAHDGAGFLPNKIVSHRHTPLESCTYRVEVSWQGFPSSETTWEPLWQICEDAPQLLVRYFSKLAPSVSSRLAKVLNDSGHSLRGAV